MDLNEYLNKKAEIRAALKDHGQAMLKALFTEFLSATPGLKVVWRQYTPYFNDGDACVFRVGEPYYIPPGADEDGADEDELSLWSIGRELNYDKKPNPHYNPTLAKLAKAFEGKLRDVEDILEDAFGDHARVTAALVDGSVVFDVEEYDHD
jgi:hypothetical protein